MNAQPEEFCPRCGHWVTHLADTTGWCPTCSGPESTDGQICDRCGHERPLDCYTTRTRWTRRVCRVCRSAQRTAWRRSHLEQSRAYDRARQNGSRRREAQTTPTVAPPNGTIRT